MENPQDILRDLALIYIALAHGTDQHLDDAEMDIIARRLQDVQPGVSQGTVLRAVKDALEAYTQDEASTNVEQAVERLRTDVPQSLRRRIVRDLTEIGKADDKFLYAEAAFIGRLVEAWKVNLTDLVDDAAATWSVLTVIAEEDVWTPVHDLVLIYLTLAHGTDETLSRKEVDAITEKVGEWLRNADTETLRRILHDAMAVYQSQEGRTFDEAVASISTTVPAYQRRAILEDLHYIAGADGVLLVEARVLIERVARAWGLSTDIQDPESPADAEHVE